ncbi:MAG: Crp/Fnr family transcriptional regulator [Limnobacter sp.]|uniref:Crp/Fnr family transcriptional regulator n=1 Tax=Limnobacter sp. TaxID=2003368 RepID=UPI0039199A4A
MMDLIDFFERFGVSKTYPKGTQIFKEGAPATFALLIADGVIQISKSDEDKHFIVALRGEGDIIGEMVFDGQPRSATAAALTEVRAFYLATETFKRIVFEEPEVAMKLFAVLLQRLRQATDQASDMALIGVYERLRKFLLARLVDQADSQIGPTDVDVNFQTIGNHLGASRDMISKIFKELVKGDYVRLNEGKVYLLRRLPPKM